MSTRLLTNLLFEPKGRHDSSLAYSIKDTVMSPDGSKVYFALQDVPAGIALTNEDYWILQMDLSASKAAMDEAVANFADYARQVGTKVSGETARASGNPVTFLPDAGSLLQPVTVLEPQQQGSGEPSPDNIRPFIGYDSLGLNASGRNLLEPVPELTQHNANDTRFFYKVGELPDGEYFLKCSNSDAYAQEYRSFILYDANRETQLFSVPYVLDGVIQIENAKGAAYAMIIVGVANADIGTTQLEYGTSRSAYAPYAGKLHTVQIGQTVYGFRYEWLTGKGWIEWVGVTFGADTPFSAWGDDLPHLFTFLLADAPVDWDVLCSHYTQHESYDKNGAYIIPQSKLLLINDIRFDNVDDFNAEIAAQQAAGTPVQIVYKPATPIPIEIQLTPHIISAADPEQTNTLYGDGTIESTYVKPLHVSIEERVAAALAAMTE